MRPKLCRAKDRPKCIMPSTGREEPKRSELLVSTANPELAVSMMGGEETEPERVKPQAGTMDSCRTEFRGGRKLAKAPHMHKDVLRPMCTKLRSEAEEPERDTSTRGANKSRRAMPVAEGAKPGRARLRVGGEEPRREASGTGAARATWEVLCNKKAEPR